MQYEIFIILITTILLGISFLINKERTLKGIRKGAVSGHKILPQFLLLLVFISVFLSVISQQSLALMMGSDSGFQGVLIAAGIGSIALIPGPIAYPLAGELMRNGVPLTIIATFITTLMMVGFLTFPVETRFLGFEMALVRNCLSFIGAIVISLLLGVLL